MLDWIAKLEQKIKHFQVLNFGKLVILFTVETSKSPEFNGGTAADDGKAADDFEGNVNGIGGKQEAVDREDDGGRGNGLAFC